MAIASGKPCPGAALTPVSWKGPGRAGKGREGPGRIEKDQQRSGKDRQDPARTWLPGGSLRVSRLSREKGEQARAPPGAPPPTGNGKRPAGTCTGYDVCCFPKVERLDWCVPAT